MISFLGVRATMRAQGQLAMAAAVLVLVFPNGGRAEDAVIEKSGYTLFNPVPESALRGFSPDRPAKSTGPFTIDAGHAQLEMDFFNYTFQKTDGVQTVTWFGPNPTLKVGLTNWLDVEVNIAPYENIRTENSATGDSSDVSGISDLFLRAKASLWGNDGGKTAAALIPFVKIPTAKRGLGNGVTEGGLIVPLQINLPNDMTLLLNTEIDVLKDGTGGGYHANYVNVAGLSLPVVKDVTFTGEIWSSINDDSAGTVRQWSLDAALAWTVRPNFQIDGGANFGLNNDTPEVQLYAGAAQRF